MKNKKEIDLKEVYNILGWVLVLIGISQIIIHEILWTKILAGALGLRYFDYFAVIGETVLIIGAIIIARKKMYRSVMIFFFVILAILFIFQVFYNIKLAHLVTNLELAGMISGREPLETITFMRYVILPIITMNNVMFLLLTYGAFSEFLESKKKAKPGSKKGKIHFILMIPFKNKDDRQLKK
jgi:hypothetical protein